MSDRAYLRSGSALNTAQLYQYIRKAFLDRIISAGTSPSKGLAIDPDIIGVIGRIAEYSALRESGVEHQCLFPLDGRRIPASSPPNIVYFCRPRVHLVKLIASQIKEHQREGALKEYTLYFVPSKTVVCEQALESEGVRGNFALVGECPLFLAPLDSDLLTMSAPFAFRDAVVHGDRTSLFHVAQGIMQLQLIYGVIPRIIGKGELAKVVSDNLAQLQREQPEANMLPSEIESLVLIDRSTDLITPLCSQLTYEGLLDEVYGIDNSIALLPPHLMPKDANGKALSAELNSGDPLFAALRDLNFSKVGPLLSKTAKNLSKQYDERLEAKSVSQMKQFTSKLKRLQDEKASIKLHTDIATELNEIALSAKFRNALEIEQNFVCGNDTDKVNEAIGDAVCQKEPLLKVLRLMCLQSVVNSGLKQKVLEGYWTDIRQAYGFQHTVTLENLAHAGLLRQQDARLSYHQLRKQFKLIVDEPADGTADDISYVFSGYAPLSVRLCQYMSRSEGGRALEEALRTIPGPFIETEQRLAEGFTQRGAVKQRVSLVFFVGGCTLAEVSALRFLGQQEGRSYIIATTDMISGNTFLSSLADELSPQFIQPAGSRSAPQPTRATRA